MVIWFDGFPLDYANDKGRGCLIEHLGIELLEAGDDYLKARMQVDNRTRTPAGVLHGGASVALAETLGTWAAAFCADPTKHHCVGLEINANHLRSARDGFVYGVARPVHLGRTTHVWEVRVSDEGGKLVCIARLTVAVLNTPGDTDSLASPLSRPRRAIFRRLPSGEAAGIQGFDDTGERRNPGASNRVDDWQHVLSKPPLAGR